MTASRLPLAFVRPNTKVRVVSIEGGRGAFRRLFELGILPGEELRVVFNDYGPVVVERAGTRFAIGRGIAARILVEVIG
ncbi:MAG: FeoA family protein [Infirmifilum sp.]